MKMPRPSLRRRTAAHLEPAESHFPRGSRHGLFTRRLALALLCTVLYAACARLPPIETLPGVTGLSLPSQPGSLQFAVLGDSGTGGRAQREVAERMIEAHALFPFEFVLMAGDNIYQRWGRTNYAGKFEQPYAELLAAGVRFYASLGNHDRPDQIFYEPFNMGGRRYYSFAPAGDLVRFFALDTSGRPKQPISADQIQWLEQELSAARERWKIGFFHHPLYSSGGRHGADMHVRQVFEPLFIRYGVNVVFSGHEHLYERLRPQNGVHYFISGGAGKLRRGDIRAAGESAAGFDQDHHFMLIELAADELHFQTISRTGRSVDCGVIRRQSHP
jgi:hypothetical protein